MSKRRYYLAAHRREVNVLTRNSAFLTFAVVLVDVDLPYWTSKVEHLVAFAVIVSNILLRMRKNGKRFGELATYSVDFFGILYDECHSITRPRFSYKVRNFGDLETFSIDFRILKAESSPYFCFRFILPTAPSLKLRWSSTAKLLRSCCWYVAWPCDLDFWPLTLTSSHTWRVTWSTLPKS